MNEALRTALKELRLSGITQTLDVRLQEAAGNGLTHAEFIELYCLRLSFPVFRQSECESFQPTAFATPADISFAFGKNARKLA